MKDNLRHTKQKWLVGDKVRITKPKEPALKNVPDCRLTAVGIISKVFMKFPKTPNLQSIVYVCTLDSELLGSKIWAICPGCDDMKLEVL